MNEKPIHDEKPSYEPEPAPEFTDPKVYAGLRNPEILNSKKLSHYHHFQYPWGRAAEVARVDEVNKKAYDKLQRKLLLMRD